MGLFSAKKTILVSSAAYNLAGDINDRPDYLKTVVTGAMLKNDKKSMAEQITGSYLNGPGIKLRSFGRWGRSSGYSNLIGQTSSSLRVGNRIVANDIINAIPHTPTQNVDLQTTEIGSADYAYWADQYMATYYPNILKGAYVVDLQESTMTVRIRLPGGELKDFTPAGFDPGAYYLYVSYVLTEPESGDPVVTGTITAVPPGEDFPSTQGWAYKGTIDGAEVYEKQTYVGQAPGSDKLQSNKQIMHLFINARQYRIDTQKVFLKSWSGVKVFIYKYGTGNAQLDAMFAPPDTVGSFFPFVPIRIDNIFVSEQDKVELYAPSKKAIKKATGGSFDKLVNKLEENEKLGDIDYAYAVFGVSLNTKDQSAKRYLYEFFQENMLSQGLTENTYTRWKQNWLVAKQANEKWLSWKNDQIMEGSQQFGDPEPPLLPYPEPPSALISINSAARPDINYDMQIYWSGIEESSHSGHGKAGVKVGEIWLEAVSTESFVQSVYADGTKTDYEAYVMDTVKINWQIDNNNFKTLTIYGLSHRNMIYGGKAVYINCIAALNDPEESGFIIPIHEDIYRRMPLKDATQMAVACCYLVLNSYQVVKQKWYQTSWFKIVLIVVIIIISIYTGGLGAGGFGVLGTNAAVGAAIGFTGTAAIIAGAIANAVAAMIITQMITYASNAIFGEKIGAIVGTIASIIAIQAGAGYMSGQGMAASFGNLMKAENILKLTEAAGKGYSQYMQAGAAEMVQDTQKMMLDYQQQSMELTKLMEQNFTTNGVIDPLSLTDSASSSYVTESLDSFLSRTLMTGSDISELSIGMIGNFADITLSTELNK